MKKILSLVLVGMIAAVTLWAKPVSFTVPLDDQEYTLVTDTENEVLPVDGISDNEIVQDLVDIYLTELDDKHYKFVDYDFEITTNVIDKAFPHYWMISEDRSYILVYSSLSDGRTVSLLFQAEENK